MVELGRLLLGGHLVRADEGVVRLVMLAAMSAVFVVALTIPEAFDDLSGGLDGPMVFALGYFAVRLPAHPGVPGDQQGRCAAARADQTVRAVDADRHDVPADRAQVTGPWQTVLWFLAWPATIWARSSAGSTGGCVR